MLEKDSEANANEQGFACLDLDSYSRGPQQFDVWQDAGGQGIAQPALEELGAT